MKKTLLSFILVMSLLLLSAGLASASVCNQNAGSIWLTANDCGTKSDDTNKFDLGETVYINGDDFECLTQEWTITGQPGGASGDPGIAVAFGTETINSDGTFCLKAYTVATDDFGEYKVELGKGNKNYQVEVKRRDLSVPTVPEFGMLAGLTTVLGALGVFFFVRKK